MFANSSKFISKLLFKPNQYNFATAKSLGSLYTWGSYCAGTGFNTSNEDPAINIPRRVEEFENNVSKVVTGRYHTAVITGDGELYTMGSGKYGALGTNSGFKSNYEPTLVSFFQENNLKVVDAALGENHSIVLTDNGEVWSFGYGGTYDLSILDRMFPRTGALGSGQNTHRFAPGKIEGLQNPVKISTGDNFAFAVSKDGQVLNWGCGKDGSLADGIQEGVLTPQINENFELLRQKEGLTIKDIQSASHFSVALLSDGNLYSWGRNNQGSLGIRANLGHVTDQVATLPTKVVNQYFEGQKIVNYSVGENSLIVLTDKNQVFWSGLDLAFKPIHWDIPANVQITKVVASLDCLAALTSDGQIYNFNEFIETSREVQGSEYSVSSKKDFDNQNIVDIGGAYGVRYAIVN